jgi:mycoredoxin
MNPDQLEPTRVAEDQRAGRTQRPAPSLDESDQRQPGCLRDEHEIVVYTRPGCPYCLLLRARLRRAGLTFREINIWNDPEAAAFVRSVANGCETVPTVTIRSISMINPNTRQVRKLAARPDDLATSSRRQWFRRDAQSGKTP